MRAVAIVRMKQARMADECGSAEMRAVAYKQPEGVDMQRAFPLPEEVQSPDLHCLHMKTGESVAFLPHLKKKWQSVKKNSDFSLERY